MGNENELRRHFMFILDRVGLMPNGRIRGFQVDDYDDYDELMNERDTISEPGAKRVLRSMLPLRVDLGTITRYLTYLKVPINILPYLLTLLNPT